MKKQTFTEKDFMSENYKIIYEILKVRPFCNCYKKHSEIYDSWCQRIAETVDMKIEDFIDDILGRNDGKKKRKQK